MGRERSQKGSKVSDLWLHSRHTSVLLSWPMNRSRGGEEGVVGGEEGVGGGEEGVSGRVGGCGWRGGGCGWEGRRVWVGG